MKVLKYFAVFACVASFSSLTAAVNTAAADVARAYIETKVIPEVQSYIDGLGKGSDDAKNAQIKLVIKKYMGTAKANELFPEEDL